MKKRTGKGEVAKVVMNLLAVGGLISVAVLAPNALQVLAPMLTGSRADRQRYYIKTVIGRLAGKGLIKFVKNSRGPTVACLTAVGKQELERYELGEKKIDVPKKWDGKYRVIIFDIKEGRRSIRDELRIWLSNLGFVRLQNSVWAHPYECREVITLLKSHFKIGRDVLYLVVESVENDKWLRKHFGLY